LNDLSDIQLTATVQNLYPAYTLNTFQVDLTTSGIPNAYIPQIDSKFNYLYKNSNILYFEFNICFMLLF
jgi:hypothetical protein